MTEIVEWRTLMPDFIEGLVKFRNRGVYYELLIFKHGYQCKIYRNHELLNRVDGIKIDIKADKLTTVQIGQVVERGDDKRWHMQVLDRR